MATQDWKTVVLKKNITKKPATARSIAKAKKSGDLQTVKKYGGGGNAKGGPSNAIKLDNETENFRHKAISQNFKVTLMKARQAKKWTQKELAQKMNVQASIIASYENGSAIPQQQVINRLQRVLGVKLPKITNPKKR